MCGVGGAQAFMPAGSPPTQTKLSNPSGRAVREIQVDAAAPNLRMSFQIPAFSNEFSAHSGNVCGTCWKEIIRNNYHNNATKNYYWKHLH